MPPSILRNIPSVNELLDSQPLKRLSDSVSRRVVVSGVRSFLETLRQEAQTTANEVVVPVGAELAERIASWILENGPDDGDGVGGLASTDRSPLSLGPLFSKSIQSSGWCRTNVM